MGDINLGLDMHCSICTAKGSIDKCKLLRCSVHESWYAQYTLTVLGEAIKELNSLKRENEELKAEILIAESVIKQYENGDMLRHAESEIKRLKRQIRIWSISREG